MDSHDLYVILENLNIEYEEIEHEPVFTVEEAMNISQEIDGVGSKNLFLKSKKNYYLIILEENKQADIKAIADLVGAPKLSFASAERLKEVLGLEQGSVTPFGIINDGENKVTVLIDGNLKGEKLLFHPNVNTKTISVAYKDLIKFIEHQKHSYVII